MAHCWLMFNWMSTRTLTGSFLTGWPLARPDAWGGSSSGEDLTLPCVQLCELMVLNFSSFPQFSFDDEVRMV